MTQENTPDAARVRTQNLIDAAKSWTVRPCDFYDQVGSELILLRHELDAQAVEIDASARRIKELEVQRDGSAAGRDWHIGNAAELLERATLAEAREAALLERVRVLESLIRSWCEMVENKKAPSWGDFMNALSAAPVTNTNRASGEHE